MATKEFTGEEWRAIYGWPYEVSSMGRVRRREKACTRKAGAYLKGGLNQGYLAVALHFDGRRSVRPIHQLVAEAFHGARAPGLQVNHVNGVKTDNRRENLEWVTASGNGLHAFRLGLARPITGEDHRNAITTAVAVAEMRLAYLSGEPFTSIAQRYGISRSSVWLMLRGKAWPCIQNSGALSLSGAINLSMAL